MLFVLGDYLAGIIIAVVTTLAVRFLVSPGMDMVIAMVLGMGAGMVIHLVLGFLMSPVLGIFETMIPGSMIGMYGGMLFGMRDCMGAGSTSLSSSLLVGAGFGALVIFGMRLYNNILRGPVLDTGE